MGSHLGRLDAKKRISVPAPYRKVLADESKGTEQGNTIVVLKAVYFDCLEAYSQSEFDRVANELQRLERYSEKRTAMETALFGDSLTTEPDKEGRIVLPDDFADYARLTDSVMFVGTNGSFLIWEPEAGRSYVAQQREKFRAMRATLPASGAESRE